MVDLENTTRPPPTGRVRFRHFVHTSSARRSSGAPRVVGDRTLEENWGRQLDGVAGGRGKHLACPAGRRADREVGGKAWGVERIERSRGRCANWW